MFPGGAKTGGTKRTMFMYAGMWSVVYKVGIRVIAFHPFSVAVHGFSSFFIALVPLVALVALEALVALGGPAKASVGHGMSYVFWFQNPFNHNIYSSESLQTQLKSTTFQRNEASPVRQGPPA